MPKPEADALFEISWEVCNKVGGIYTVISSKAPQMIKHYKNYFLIGPYFPRMAIREFYPEAPPDNIKRVIDIIKDGGITVFYGRWLIKGRPVAILIDFTKLYEKKNEIKGQLWEEYRIDSLYAGTDFDEPVVWSTAVGRLIEELAFVFKGNVVAHFHEWLSGAGILYLKKRKSRIRTVFTTHATVLGRSFAAGNIDLYYHEDNKCILELLDIEKEAYKFGVAAKHQLEKKCTQLCDVFTTVSEITGLEATHILKREPDLLVPNGLDHSVLPNKEEIPIRHRLFKEKIREFVMPYFFPYYSFELEDTLFFFLSGRYEFRNKGIDITIKALSILNEKLKESESQKTIVVFFFVPNNIKTIKMSLLESKALFEDIKDKVDDSLGDIRIKMIYSIANQKMPSESTLFDEDFLLELKKDALSFKKNGEPMLCTHDLVSDDSDAILNCFRENKLLNKKMDRVKVIHYPCYLSGSDGLLDLDYYSTLWGCHLGIFPSYYEPWGYTPLECAGYGVPSITTDLAGLGRFLIKCKRNEEGIFVIKREKVSEEEVVKELAERLFTFANLSKEERINYKLRAINLIILFSWEKLVENYIEAHNRAIAKGKS